MGCPISCIANRELNFIHYFRRAIKGISVEVVLLDARPLGTETPLPIEQTNSMPKSGMLFDFYTSKVFFVRNSI